MHTTFQPFVDRRFRRLGIALTAASVLAYAWFVFQGIASASQLSAKDLVDLLVFRSLSESAGRWIRSLFLVGVLLIILAPEEREDEWIQQTRTSSLATTFLISLISILGYTIAGPVATEQLVSVNVWINLTALTYLIIFRFNLRSGLQD